MNTLSNISAALLHRWLVHLPATILLLSTSAAAAPRNIDVPLVFDNPFLREALVSQVYTTTTKKAVVWDDGTGCGYLKLREPAITSSGSRVRIVSHGEARVGTAIGDQCIAPLQWEGLVEVFEEPVVSPDQTVLSFRVVESNVYDSEGKKPFFSGTIWDLVKRYVQPRFETVRIDLHDATADLHDVLPMLLTHDDTTRIDRMINSLHIASASVVPDGVSVVLNFLIEPRNAPTAAPEPTLTSEELEHVDAAMKEWDSFLTFALLKMWGDTLITELRQPIADVLIDARFDILDALAPSEPDHPDNVPGLFVKTWERLAPIVRQSVSRQPGSTALRYMSFLTAGDALAALQQAGPEIGVDISADGLRRLARIIAPSDAADPLQYDTTVDQSLRTLLGFGPPLPAPDLSAEPQDESWWRTILLPASAMAAADAPPADLLRRWVALPETLDTYLPAVHEVLDLVTKTTLESARLEPQYRDVYRNAVLATAWQESCWRQFILKGSQITYLKSGVGASGMMQVNERVWRGVYDLKGLRWDIKYNGRAGSEILLHYMDDYAIAKKEDKTSGGVDNLARASYAIYNGGPGAISRYRKTTTKPRLKKIDQLFWEKYQSVSKGKIDVQSCYSGGDSD